MMYCTEPFRFDAIDLENLQTMRADSLGTDNLQYSSASCSPADFRYFCILLHNLYLKLHESFQSLIRA